MQSFNKRIHGLCMDRMGIEGTYGCCRECYVVRRHVRNLGSSLAPTPGPSLLQKIASAPAHVPSSAKIAKTTANTVQNLLNTRAHVTP